MSTNDTKQQVTLSEHLSALLDDEAGAFEQKRVLDELKTDTALANKLAHFALIKETLHSSETAGVYAGASFLKGIHDKLEDEPAFTSHALEDATTRTARKQTSSWLRPVGGFAMAASLAALAVIGFQNYVGNPKTENTTAIETLAKSANTPTSQLTQEQMDSAVLVEPVVASKATGADKSDKLAALGYQQADARTRALLKRYVDSHMQYASTRAFVPSVRVIAYSDY
jgi:negative regulator of sigma E activity